MSMAFWQRLAVLAILGLGSVSPAAMAAQFEQQEVDQDRFIVVAAPGGEIGYKLLILEQLNDKRPCWSETGSNPSQVEPLLLSFDFTGICNRIVDSNGFSVRTAGQDQALHYSLRIVRDGNDLVLVADANADRDTLIEIGRTYGMPNGFSRIVLNPGWRLTRRAFNGRPVGHIYLTYDQPIETLIASSRRNLGMGGPAPAPTLPNPAPEQFPAEAESIIPVPSLPPGDAPVPPPPPLNPRPVPTPPTGSPNSTAPSNPAPSLSSILPPPPPANPTDTPTDTPTDAAPESPPTIANPPADRETPSAEATQPNRPVPQRTSSAPSRVSPPAVGVPTTSNSGGAALRPRSQRRVTGSSESTTERTTTARNANRNTTQAANRSAPEADSSDDQTLAETYQVIVVADDAELQDKVRAISPSAILTTINGQVVMQVGLFRNREEADRLQQRLSLEGLPTAVIPVR
ncbi:MAG: DUF3747 domain-containing protein [Leptolyngbya sp. IPPAS B-1204]|nr:DUF3747 domain-containing protein [Elainella sp. C42_A2020_010]RNJ68063.1 MAG: DUF3747 domain-containing protein [Leptolyngbya sp. IPPAS B-1204]